MTSRNALLSVALLASCHTYTDAGIETVRKNEPDFRLCLQEAASRNPNVRGTLELSFEIGGKGDVLSLKPTADDFRDAAFTTCALAKAKAWTFPPPRNGKTARFSYKFSLNR